MGEGDRTYRIFVSAAEVSGDSHCGGLISALKKSGKNIEFVGVGGSKMAAAGCEILEETAGRAVMIHNAFGAVFRFCKLIWKIKRYLKNNKVDLVIVCDSPAFNFHVAKAAKKLKIKTMFYVAPQLWAWAEWRIKKMKKCCDKLCCILPFEEEWFRQRGIDVTYVGSPLLEESTIAARKDYSGFNPTKAKIALLPGSRQAEIDTLWPAMQEIALKLRKKYSNVSFITVVVEERKKEVLRSMQPIGFKCQYMTGTVEEAASEADMALVASGSATLQVAAAGCPMVVMYQSNKIIWHLAGRWLLKTKLLSLVNILAGCELVAEFMPYFDSIEPITETAEQMLDDSGGLAGLSGQLIELVRPLGEIKASEKTAEIVEEMLATMTN